jgi:hypothetical protein
MVADHAGQHDDLLEGVGSFWMDPYLRFALINDYAVCAGIP